MRLNFLQHLSPEKENVLFSPISLNIFLSMILTVAKHETADEIRSILHQPKEVDSPAAYNKLITNLNKVHDNFTLEIINKLYVNDSFPIVDPVGEILSKYHIAFENINLLRPQNQTLRTINKWIQSRTNSAIRNVVQKINTKDSMLFINAINFEAMWQTEFKIIKDRIKFYVTNDSIIELPQLLRLDNFDYYEDDDFQMLRIPYIDNEYSMVILLPSKGKALKDIEIELLDKVVNGHYDSMMKQENVRVTIPNFIIQQSHNFKNFMKKVRTH